MTPKSQATEEKKINWISLKFKAEEHHQVKGQPTEYDKIFANHISDKSLLSRMYKELLQNSYNSAIKRQIVQFLSVQRD